MRHIQLFEEFHGPQEVKKVSSTELGDVIDKSMTTKEKPIIIWTESGEMGEPQFQQILSELGVSASFVDLGRSVPKDLDTIVGAEVVVGFDLDRAPAEVASIMMGKATQGDSQYIFTADDLDRVNREMLDRCQIVSYLQNK
jgi:hypothetical protein